MNGKHFDFRPPSQVLGDIQSLLTAINVGIEKLGSASNYDKLDHLSNMFCQFGAIHPFLDGNGHVQRALFAASALELGIPLSNRFAIHPRTYDGLLAFPLEMYTRSPSNQVDQWRAMVAEYLANWLGGQFDAPGMGMR